MDPSLLIQMIIAAIIGTILYTIIGIVPGTDETAVIAPVTMAVVLAGVSPIVVLTFTYQPLSLISCRILCQLQLLG